MSSIIEASNKKRWAALAMAGLAAIALSLTANVIGLGHHVGFGWKKMILLLAGIGSCVLAGFASAKPRTADQVIRVAFGCTSAALLLLVITAHRIHLGQNPGLRWTKALLILLSTALAGASFSYCRRRMAPVLGVVLLYLGFSLVTLSLAGSKFELPHERDAELLALATGISALVAAVLLLPKPGAWLTISETGVPTFGVPQMPSTANKTGLLAFAFSITALITCTNRNWIFGESADHWFHVRSFMEPMRYLQPPFTDFYQYDRQPWNFFAATFYQLVPNPATADIALHVGVAFLYLFLMSLVLMRLFSLHIALLVSTLSLFCPIILFMLASNYIPGGVTLSLLATFYFLADVLLGRASATALLGAGFFAASSALCRPDTLLPVFCLLIASLLVNWRGAVSGLWRKLGLFIAGFLALLLPLCLVNYVIGGDFVFFSSSVRAAQSLRYLSQDYVWGEKSPMAVRLLFFPLAMFWISLASVVWIRFRRKSDIKPQHLLILYFYVIHSAFIIALYAFKQYVVTKPDIYYINFVFAFLVVAVLLDQWIPTLTWREFWLQFGALIFYLAFIYRSYLHRQLDFSSFLEPRDKLIYAYAIVFFLFVLVRYTVNNLHPQVLVRDAKALLLPCFLALVLVSDGWSIHNLTKFLGPYTWTPEGVKLKGDILAVGYQALSYIAPRCAHGNCIVFASVEDEPKWFVHNVTSPHWSFLNVAQTIDKTCQTSYVSQALGRAPEILLIAIDQTGAESLKSTLRQCGIPVEITDWAAYTARTEKIYLQSGFLRQYRDRLAIHEPR